MKGILKRPSTFDRSGSSFRKSTRFDEQNVLQTYHPLEKDYGHLKINKPKTPFNFFGQSSDQPEHLDVNLLAEKLRLTALTQTPSFGNEDLSDDEFPETEDEKVRRLEFERRRKAHYNEFEAVRLARKLMEEEIEEDDEDELTANDEAKSKATSDHLDSGEHSPGAGEEPHLGETSEDVAESEHTTTTDALSGHEYPPGHPCAGRR